MGENNGKIASQGDSLHGLPISGHDALYLGMVTHLLLGVLFLILRRRVFTPILHGIFDTVTLLGLPLALFVLLRRVDRRLTEDAHYWVLVRWAASGTVVTFLLVILYLLSVSLTAVLPPEPAFLLILAADLGGLAGTLLGFQVLQVQLAERRADRAEVRANQSEQHREILTLLNRMLRHHVLNGLNVVNGFVAQSEPHIPDDHHLDSETTGERIDEMVDYVEEIQFTVNALSQQIDLTETDLTALIERECERARENHPSATIETDLPAHLQIEGTNLLGRVFRHLLENAVIHNDHDEPTVTVAATESAESVTVTVTDDGQGIPDEKKTAYFIDGEHGVESLGEGIGLFLTDAIVTRCDGTVHIEDVEPHGARIVITLPLTQSDRNEASVSDDSLPGFNPS